MAEQVESLLAYVLCIVPILKHGACGEFVPYLRQVMHELVVVFVRLEVFRHLRSRDTLKDIENQYGMVCCQ